MNRASTQANLPLLREINAAKGGVLYRYDGGPVGSGDQTPPSTHEEYLPDGPLMPVRTRPHGLQWLPFSAGGVVPHYLAEGGVASPYPYRQVTRDQAGQLARRYEELNRLARESESHQTGTSFSAQDKENLTRQLRERAATARARLAEAGVDPANPFAGFPAAAPPPLPARRVRSGRVGPTPADLLAANRAFNAQNMGLQQAMFRSGAFDDAALGAVAQRREQENRAFQDRYGAVTAPLRLRETFDYVAGAGIRGQADRDARRANSEYWRRLGYGGATATGRHTGPTQFSVIGSTYRGPLGFAAGGAVPGSGSGDTVPALLSPGEFVFSRPAVSALGAANLNRVHRFATGGIVPGGSAGGGPGASGMLGLSQEARTAMDQFAGHSKDLGVALAGFAAPAGLLASALRGFDSGVDKFAGAVGRIPGEIALQTRGTLEVVYNGAEFMSQVSDVIDQRLATYVMTKLDQELAVRFPDTPKPLRGNI